MRREILFPVCVSLLFCVSHVVTCRCSHCGNPSVQFTLHVAPSPWRMTCIRFSSPQPSDVQTKCEVSWKTLDLWYKLFWFYFESISADCKTLCCPLVEHESLPFGVYKDVYFVCLQLTSDEQTPKRQKKRASFCSSDKQKRNCNVGNQLAGWCFSLFV